jgi:hypothetical protein
LEDFDVEKEINTAWETNRGSTKISAKEIAGYFGLPWLHERCSKLLNKKKRS